MATDPIEHVVVLMLENHSFDQMLGGMRAEFPELDGVDPTITRSNRDTDGVEYFQTETTATVMRHDPIHELDNVLRQLDDGNDGFVRDFAQAYPASTHEERQQILGYFAAGSLPALHELARHFTVCDRWHASVPGPTWANRFFAHSGTSLGRVKMPESAIDSARHPGLYFGYDQDTIYDRFNERGVHWRIYHGDIPQSLVLTHQRRPENARRYQFMDVFFSDLRDERRFPAFSFIEPSYYWPGQNDDHPPHTTVRAQALLMQVYNALRANERLWASTLLVVLYDEHGGFYDHVIPPLAPPPDRHVLPSFAFDRLGVRVPALLVSPWAERAVVHTLFDHTSLLKYVTEKWGLLPLTDRVNWAASLGSAIRTTGQPRQDTPHAVRLPMMAAAPEEMVEASPGEPLNGHQKALIAFSEYLEHHEIEEPLGKPARTAAMMAGPMSQVETAKSRVELFLEQQKAKAGG